MSNVSQNATRDKVYLVMPGPIIGVFTLASETTWIVLIALSLLLLPPVPLLLLPNTPERLLLSPLLDPIDVSSEGTEDLLM